MSIVMIEIGSPLQARLVAKSLAVTHVMVHVPTYLQIRKRGQRWATKMRALREAVKKLRSDQTLVLRTLAVPSWIRGGNFKKRVDLLSSKWWELMSANLDAHIRRAGMMHELTVGCIDSEIHGAAKKRPLDGDKKKTLADIGDLGGLAAAITDEAFCVSKFAFAMPGRLTGGGRTFRSEQQSVIANLTGDVQIAQAYKIGRARRVPEGSVVHLVIHPEYETAAAAGKWRLKNPERDVFFGPWITDSQMRTLLSILRTVDSDE